MKMMKEVLNVSGMSCSHCVTAITSAVEGLDGVTDVIVDLGAKTVTVEYNSEKVSLGELRRVIEEEGYDVV
jgi:copper chaperone